MNKALLGTCLLSFLAATADAHPLDSLSAREIDEVVAAVRSDASVTQQTRFASVRLAPPDKNMVWKWSKGEPSRRQALVVTRTGTNVRELLVDIASRRIVSVKDRTGVQTQLSGSDWALATRLVKADRRWRAAMRKRGITDVSGIFCDGLSVGTSINAERRRLARVPCYDARGITNVYGRPIEGLMALVDLDSGSVLQVEDSGPVPISTADPSLEQERQTSVRPAPKSVSVAASDVWNFKVEGSRFHWGKWSFHLGFDQRVGPIISTVSYRDGTAERPVMYQGHASEMFVPYMDPDPNWSFRSYMDIGEYGFGTLASTLVPGADCPARAMLLSAVLAGPDGKPYRARDVMCAFERNTTVPLWRRSEVVTRSHEARADVEFVLRTIPTVGNYDYVYDWVFSHKGEMKIEVGATGIAAAKGVRAKTVGQGDGEKLYGALVGPNLAAPNHDHFLSFRLDLDIDGISNRFVRDRIVPTSISQPSNRTSLWTLNSAVEPTELSLEPVHQPEVWRVESSTARTALGYAPSFEIAGHSATSLLAPGDPPQRRAAFAARPLWVTTYKPDELYASGDYPNQSSGGEGLPAFVNGERLTGQDLVVWYTMGFHHVTRPEDWPVLSTVQHKVTLRPNAFFTQNPAMDLPRDVQPVRTAPAPRR